MRLGIVVEYYSFRADVRHLLEALSHHFEVVVFAEEAEAAEIALRHETRTISVHRRSVRKSIVDLLYLLFGNRPGTEHHYKWRRRNLASNRTGAGRRARWLLEIGRRMPRLFGFDTYLELLRGETDTTIGDIDVFLNFSNVSNPVFLSAVVREKRPIFTYVYSWDHPGKYRRFLTSGAHYLTWNEGLREDLTLLHQIDTAHVTPIGSSQFTFIQEYLTELSERPRMLDFPYVYFGAAAGYVGVAQQELTLVRLVSEALEEVAPEVTLVVRPYPVVRDWSIYDSLRSLPNVLVESYGRSAGLGPDSDQVVWEKLNKLQHALAFVHIGTTMGLEASYLGTPVIHLDLRDVEFESSPRDPNAISHLIHTYHGEKYMLKEQFPNVVRSRRQLRDALEASIREPTSMLGYGQSLAAETPLKNLDELAKEFDSLIRRAVAPEV